MKTDVVIDSLKPVREGWADWHKAVQGIICPLALQPSILCLHVGPCCSPFCETLRPGLLQCCFGLPPLLLCLQQPVLIRKLSGTFPGVFQVLLCQLRLLEPREQELGSHYPLLPSLLGGSRSCRLPGALLQPWVSTLPSSPEPQRLCRSPRWGCVCRGEAAGCRGWGLVPSWVALS